MGHGILRETRLHHGTHRAASPSILRAVVGLDLQVVAMAYLLTQMTYKWELHYQKIDKPCYSTVLLHHSTVRRTSSQLRSISPTTVLDLAVLTVYSTPRLSLCYRFSNEPVLGVSR